MAKRCQFFLQEKQRFCSFQCKAGFDMCGNHLEGDGAGKRVPCPVDPRHTVLLSELQWHLPRCPKGVQRLQQQAQAHYRPNCNAGSSDYMPASSPDAHMKQNGHGASDTPDRSSAAERVIYARSLGPVAFSALLARIEAAFHKVCGEPSAAAEVIPRECLPVMEQSGLPMPSTQHVKAFAIKHARQQAAILGQMQQAGLLQRSRSTIYVEYGAGKGYLSCMLAESFGAAELVLVDCDSFRLTADRTLRKMGAALQRVKADIKDFDPAGLPSLVGGQPWVAMGKHLCGAATDFTLRCVARCAAAKSHGMHGSVALAEQLQPGDMAAAVQTCLVSGGCNIEGSPKVDSSAVPQPSGTAEACFDTLRSGNEGRQHGVQGCAVATCCHHRCTWRHYVGKALFRRLGFSAAEFELISWMTGWALCGHGRPNKCQNDDASSEDEDSASEDIPDVPEQVMPPDSEQEREFEPSMSVPRERRQIIGAQCKRLIDAGRWQYLQDNGLPSAKAVQYVDGMVSGENWLLLATC
ncbi:tRNA:m(4)X modification enzyme TRM13 homolog [Coccomyxa sp. Obi]|nr:tRNA:m(4)X modification enzyme TRM13 homolog [Coccomyxa sp. Obi]